MNPRHAHGIRGIFASWMKELIGDGLLARFWMRASAFGRAEKDATPFATPILIYYIYIYTAQIHTVLTAIVQHGT